MLLYEFSEDINQEQSLVALIELIKKRYENNVAEPKINTLSFLKLSKNIGVNLDYGTFAEIFEQSQAIKNLVKNFNKQYIELKSDDAVSSDDSHSGDAEQQNQKDTVSAMAKKAVDI